MNWADASPATLGPLIWQRLAAAPDTPADPMRTPVFASGDDGDWSLRTVVLRAVNAGERELTGYSDARAAKVRQSLRHAAVQWLFYDAAARIQVRLRGRCRLHHRDPVAVALWETVPEASRINYRTSAAPGEPLSDAASPPDGDATGQENFAVLITTVDEMDWLELGAPRHRRMRLRWTDDQWLGQWTTP